MYSLAERPSDIIYKQVQFVNRFLKLFWQFFYQFFYHLTCKVKFHPSVEFNPAKSFTFSTHQFFTKLLFKEKHLLFQADLINRRCANEVHACIKHMQGEQLTNDSD